MFKTKSDQRGIAHLGLIVAVLVVLIGAGVAICRVSSNNSNKNNSSSSSSSSGKVTTDKQTEDACNTAVHDSTLCKFAASYNPTNTAYKATATTTNGDNDGTLTIESDGKGNYSLSGTSAGQSLDTITIGSTSYIKDASSGTWFKYGSDSSSSTSNPASDFKLSVSDITGNGSITYKNLGTEACGSLTCYKYQQIDKNNASDTSYFWFDNKDYQLRRFSITDPSTGTTDMSFSYENVSITAPSPVQDVSQ